MSKKDSKETKHLDTIIEILENFFTSAMVLFLIYWTIAMPEGVAGASMEPTIYTEERILVDKVSKHFSEYERGDIVVLNPPDTNKDYIKRVVGVPGDVIKIFDCTVYVSREDGRFALEEPYLYDNICTQGGRGLEEGRSIRLGEDEYVVLGDNRTDSIDSRYFGVIQKDAIIGRVVLRFWPLNRITTL